MVHISLYLLHVNPTGFKKNLATLPHGFLTAERTWILEPGASLTKTEGTQDPTGVHSW